MLAIFSEVSFLSAFVAGAVTLLLPCTLPVLLGYIGVMTGATAKYSERRKVVLHTVFFSLGFILVYSFFGSVAGWFGQFSTTTLLIGSISKGLTFVGGILLIVFGLVLLKSFFGIKFFKEMHFLKVPKWTKDNFLGSTVIGIAVAVGWSPCISPILGTLLVYAATSTSVWFGLSLLLIYTLGLTIPLIICSYIYGTVFTQSANMKTVSKYISIIGGILLILLGVLFVTGYAPVLSSFTADSSLYSLF